MPTQEAIAREAGISKFYLNKLIKGSKVASRDLKKLLSVRLRKAAGKSYDAELVIEHLDILVHDQHEQILNLTNELNQHRRGTKTSIFFYACYLTTVLIIFALVTIPLYFKMRLEESHGLAIAHTKIEYLEKRVADLELLIDRYETYEDKRDQEEIVKNARFNELIDRITEVTK